MSLLNKKEIEEKWNVLKENWSLAHNEELCVFKTLYFIQEMQRKEFEAYIQGNMSGLHPKSLDDMRIHLDSLMRCKIESEKVIEDVIEDAAKVSKSTTTPIGSEVIAKAKGKKKVSKKVSKKVKK